MTTWGTFGLIVCSFIIPPIVILHRGSIPSCRIWIIAIPIVTLSTYLGLFLGPVIFFAMVAPVEWPSLYHHMIMIIVSFAFSLLMATTLYFAKRKNEKEAMLRKQRIQDAIENITADGVVSGPKGPRAPHKQWNVGIGSGTPHETRGPNAHGPYGLPMH